jgi:hypothetical protein
VCVYVLDRPTSSLFFVGGGISPVSRYGQGRIAGMPFADEVRKACECKALHLLSKLRSKTTMQKGDAEDSKDQGRNLS